ncbi:PopZ family protein [Chelatococcus reniformis]|nr:DUF2497 domain-containing protein [Chelatococcus reniformis]
MDDILASIRRIISDDQRALGLGDLHPARPAPRRTNEELPRLRPSIDRDLQRLTSIRPRVPDDDELAESQAPVRAVMAQDEHERGARELELDDDRAGRGADHGGRESHLDQRDAAQLPHDVTRPAPDPRLRYAEPAPLAAGRPPDADRLTSRSVDASVGSAFDALTASITHRARTMEEVVAEMLRPMLREWLEDNLPDLVEQLVRKEIERVVRGGRRD